ncbi:MAG: hypothetical protein R3301_06175 [Saprospiraceae bacterium]|nr:hypothetical protein [Saprospiraceae bacterium]
MKSALAICLLLVPLCVQAQNVGIGIGVPAYRLHVEGDPGSTFGILGAQVTFSGFSDVPAVTGYSVTNDGWGYGGLFTGGYMGVNATASAGSYAGWAYGLYGTSFGTDGTRVGVYGYASGGVTNWAGYFAGETYIQDRLGISTTDPQDKLHVDGGNIRLSGIAPFYILNSTSPTTPSGYIFQENGNQEGVLHYNASGNYVNLTNSVFNPGVVVNLNTNAIGIGSFLFASGYTLNVDGKIIAEELKVQDSGGWPDFVFAEDYPLMDLDNVEQWIKDNGHLPGVPSAEAIAETGIMIGDMQKLLMQKIEELTLYILQLKEQNARLESRVRQLEKQ